MNEEQIQVIKYIILNHDRVKNSKEIELIDENEKHKRFVIRYKEQGTMFYHTNIVKDLPSFMGLYHYIEYLEGYMNLVIFWV